MVPPCDKCQSYVESVNTADLRELFQGRPWNSWAPLLGIKVLCIGWTLYIHFFFNILGEVHFFFRAWWLDLTTTLRHSNPDALSVKAVSFFQKQHCQLPLGYWALDEIPPPANHRPGIWNFSHIQFPRTSCSSTIELSSALSAELGRQESSQANLRVIGDLLTYLSLESPELQRQSIASA